MGQFLRFSDQHNSLVAMVRNLGTNYVSPQFHVVVNKKFTIIQNDNRLEDSTIESIFNDVALTCRDFHGGEGLPPEGAVDALEGAAAVDPPPELGGEWLTEEERLDENSSNEKWRARQHEVRSDRLRILKN